MVANPKIFQAIIINRCGRYNELLKLNIEGEEITSQKVVTLLGIDLDYKLNFKSHIGNYVRKLPAN